MPAAHAAPIEFDEYVSRIRESIALVQRGDGRLGPEHAAILRQRFPRTLLITCKGKPLEADCELLGKWIDEAEKSAAGRGRLLTHMNALLDQIGKGPESMVSEQKAKAALDKVFGSGEFRHLQESGNPAWRLWVQERLRRFLAWLKTHFEGIEGRSLAWTSLAILGAVAIAGIVLIIWVIRTTGRTGWRWRQARVRQPEAAPEKVQVDWSRLRLEAEKKAVSGELREAVRALFLSVLLEGHAKGWWVYRAESTNTEHLLQIDHAQRKDAFRRLAELYENAWYGLKTPKPDDFAACRRWAEQMGNA